MKLEGTKEFEAPREVVWSVINDPSKMAKTLSCRTSCLTALVVLLGSYASSRYLKLILRPLMPPCALTYLKYASDAGAISE